jgi:2-polyprenyl-3-methyl-5-hydroxy-6-metoxy-1,4-benzoquinol methylase
MSGVKKYFEDNAEQWILNGYGDDGYNYPTAFHRVRIVSRFISSLNKKKLKIVDLACGGGDLICCLASDGHIVTGIDQSKKMLDIAESRQKELPKKIQNNIKFLRGEIGKKLDLGGQFDAVAAMGIIGYLPNDKIIFNAANSLLKPGGYFLVSCRNRLFNMISIGKRTEKEIKNKGAIKLIREIGALYDKVPAKDAERFIKNFKKIAAGLPEKMSFDKKSMLSPAEKYAKHISVLDAEPRQNMPDELKKTALKCGFKHRAYYGVHPHLMDPNLNKMLPPRLFNKISGCLEALEHLPMSLAWSSVFIGVFQKSKRR